MCNIIFVYIAIDSMHGKSVFRIIHIIRDLDN